MKNSNEEAVKASLCALGNGFDSMSWQQRVLALDSVVNRFDDLLYFEVASACGMSPHRYDLPFTGATGMMVSGGCQVALHDTRNDFEVTAGMAVAILFMGFDSGIAEHIDESVTAFCWADKTKSAVILARHSLKERFSEANENN